MPDTEKLHAETVGALVREATAQLRQAGVDEADRAARWIVEEVIDTRWAQIVADPDRPVTDLERATVRKMVHRRAAGEPLQHILGYTSFRGLRLDVSPDVLIPRPETEQVVERLLQLYGNTRSCDVLDAGTGSGCIALALKAERPDWRVIACDISSRALAVARKNAARHGLDVDFRRADMLSPDFAEQVGREFNLVVSNPPYVTVEEEDTMSSEVRDHEPSIALFASGGALQFYRALAQHSEDLLADRGLLIVEINEAYGTAVKKCFESAGLRDVEVYEDLAGRERIVSGWRK